MNIKLGCSMCNYSFDKKVNMPFDTDSVTCPKCRESESIYIISVNDNSKVRDLNDINEKMLDQLIKIRQL